MPALVSCQRCQHRVHLRRRRAEAKLSMCASADTRILMTRTKGCIPSMPPALPILPARSAAAVGARERSVPGLDMPRHASTCLDLPGEHSTTLNPRLFQIQHSFTLTQLSTTLKRGSGKRARGGRDTCGEARDWRHVEACRGMSRHWRHPWAANCCLNHRHPET